jgi:hypothetical protein
VDRPSRLIAQIVKLQRGLKTDDGFRDDLEEFLKNAVQIKFINVVRETVQAVSSSLYFSLTDQIG